MIFFSRLWFLVILGIILLGPVFYSSISDAQIKTDEVINKLDANYYYPQRKGLINIAARLKWEQQVLTSEQKAFLEKPDFRFYAEFKGENSRKRVRVDNGRIALSDDEKAKYLMVLNNYLDAFIPKTLHEKFSKYQGQTKFFGKEKLLVRFESIDS